jgi:hypothetical protein
MATIEERVSHIEGASGQWATKSDLAELKAELKGDISSVIKWMAMVQLGGLAAIAAIMGFLA